MLYYTLYWNKLLWTTYRNIDTIEGSPKLVISRVPGLHLETAQNQSKLREKKSHERVRNQVYNCLDTRHNFTHELSSCLRIYVFIRVANFEKRKNVEYTKSGNALHMWTVATLMCSISRRWLKCYYAIWQISNNFYPTN